jgi:hypothetical protein
MGEDHLQPRIHVFEPGLNLGLGQLRLGQGFGLRGGGSLGCRGIQNRFGEAPTFLRQRGAGGHSR